ncbi:Vacuolar protein sorting-associated protein 4 [Pyricularia oryzae]|uniref:Vacuolar protein sorting-associated protein 4 n=1 Tax=Pyricularia grisea TaxID=148305 RepID=A0ABQ8N6U1_PYRGI|nr:Vacuolar protein sorting-associated protein 4 [Pyricularia oryzae]KAI6291883.1 Vacuolar protein sorting-associated protein 4 [Pyricularia grisea]KAI6272571.1 Vacuolar protein sorting-associated protein 4 [Pyricularia oryzae]KAI6288720.1 Vacuolar protein sorting-associated protein 4 [Pyricularia oryzae]KAI6347133.1 Vacuolar protein sorting-associated protein 4 [Pyricularia oryzae]
MPTSWITHSNNGINKITSAVKFDEAGKYQQAFENYMSGCDDLMLAVKKNDAPEETRVALRRKMAEYLLRAEKLDAHLKAEKSKKEATNGESNGAIASNGQDDDSKKLRNALEGVVLQERPNVKWEDVAGLEGAKESLKEAVLLPIKFPHFFSGKRKPWKGILLYGPPGTGKSFLAKAVATEAKSTFFSVSSSDLVSKWMGESERLVKQLFAMARENKPSIIFIDEVDALCGARGEGESEASRRIKTEMLVQMDGVGKDTEGVLVLGATNIPWQLDSAIRRRFQRRVHISLPDVAARTTMFKLAVGDTPSSLTNEDYRELAKMAEGYSGSDISNVVNDALMQPVRKMQMATHFKKIIHEGAEKYTACSPGDPAAVEMTLWQLEGKDLVEPLVTKKDMERAINSTRPTVSQDDLKKNADWTEEFGSEGA